MRNAASFEDCNVLFRELYNQLDRLNSKDLNMEKRRVVNASPSKDSYDYVVRKELFDAFENIPESKATAIATKSSYVIVFSNSGAIKVATQASGPYIFKRKSSSLIVSVSAVSPPTSGDARFNLKHNGVNILVNDIILPSTAASLEVVNSTDFISSPITFEIDDTLVLEVVSTSGVSKITVELYVKEI